MFLDNCYVAVISFILISSSPVYLLITGKWSKWVMVKYIWDLVPERAGRRSLSSENSTCNFHDWASVHVLSPWTVLKTLTQIVRKVPGRALGFVVKGRGLSSFLNHAMKGAYSFMKRFSLWKTTLGKTKTVWFLVQCLFGLFSLCFFFFFNFFHLSRGMIKKNFKIKYL